MKEKGREMRKQKEKKKRIKQTRRHESVIRKGQVFTCEWPGIFLQLFLGCGLGEVAGPKKTDK